MALMIESIMYLGIGFLAASISVLAVVPIDNTSNHLRIEIGVLRDRLHVALAELKQLIGAFALELLDLHLQSSRRHREFGPQQILVGCDFRH
jgi:hypothetical protein